MRADRCASGLSSVCALLFPVGPSVGRQGLEGFSGVLSRVSRSIVLDNVAGAAFRLFSWMARGPERWISKPESTVCREYAVSWLSSRWLCAEESTKIGQRGLNQNQHLSVQLR